MAPPDKGKRPIQATTPTPAKRRRLPNYSTYEAYVLHCGNVRHRVYGFLNSNQVICSAAEEIIQDIFRGAMDRIRYRWERNLPIGVLNSRTVKLVDNAVLILDQGVGPEDHDYQGKAITLFLSVFGKAGFWTDRDHFLSLLSTPKLSLAQFDALYFHKLLQKGLQRAYWIPCTIDRLKHQWVEYKGWVTKWEAAYDKWERIHYPETINIEKAAQKDQWALGYYDNTPSDRLKFIRNLWLHINDYRNRDGLEDYSCLERGLLIQELFPTLSNRL